MIDESMIDDPFSPLADPYPPKKAEPAATPARAEDMAERPREMSRKNAIRLMLFTPVAASMASGCLVRRLACETAPGDARHCQYRFCRYYRG